jgi:hypothetical protein
MLVSWKGFDLKEVSHLTGGAEKNTEEVRFASVLAGNPE